MSSFFGDRLLKAREAAGLSGYKIVQLTGIAQGNLQAIEKGRRSPSDANLEALAAVDDLGVSLDELKAWRDLDRIGIEGIERIKKFAPEVLDGSLASKASTPEPEADPFAEVRSAFPSGLKHPLKPKELKILKAMGPQGWADYDIRPGSYLWTVPFEERWPEIKEAWEGWKEDRDQSDEPTG